MTTQELYIKLQFREITPKKFLYEVRRDPKLSGWITQFTSFDDAVKILKNKSIIFEMRSGNLDRMKALAKQISLDDEVVQHVNDNEDGTYSISDWFDDEATVASYENGFELGTGDYGQEEPSDEDLKDIDDEEWIDPAGGTHYGDEDDPAAQYVEENFDDQLKRGIEVEKEHTDDPKIAEKIARDHLEEDPEYYTKLDKAGLEEVDIKSTLEKIVHTAWKEPNLEKAKNLVTSFLQKSGIKDEDKQRMLNNIEDIKNKFKFDYYLANSLLSYEGHGLGQLSEAKEKKKALTPDDVNFYEFTKGIAFELDEGNVADLEKAKAKVLKNLAKHPNYYSMMASGQNKKVKNRTDEMIPLNKQMSNTVDKGNAMKPPKGAGGKVKANVKDSLNTKEKGNKKPKGVKEMGITPKKAKGVKTMDMPKKEKTIKLKEMIRKLVTQQLNEAYVNKDGELSDFSFDGNNDKTTIRQFITFLKDELTSTHKTSHPAELIKANADTIKNFWDTVKQDDAVHNYTPEEWKMYAEMLASAILNKASGFEKHGIPGLNEDDMEEAYALKDKAGNVQYAKDDTEATSKMNSARDKGVRLTKDRV